MTTRHDRVLPSFDSPAESDSDRVLPSFDPPTAAPKDRVLPSFDAPEPETDGRVLPSFDAPTPDQDTRVLPSFDAPAVLGGDQPGRTVMVAPARKQAAPARPAASVPAPRPASDLAAKQRALDLSVDALGREPADDRERHRMVLLAGRLCRKQVAQDGHLPWAWHVCPACFPE